MVKIWDKLNSFLDKHFEVAEKPEPAEPPVRKFYKITAYTGFAGEEEVEYYSTANTRAVKQYANEMMRDLAEHAAMEHYWRDAFDDESEDEYCERFYKSCGVCIDVISKEEYFAQKRAVWRME